MEPMKPPPDISFIPQRPGEECTVVPVHCEETRLPEETHPSRAQPRDQVHAWALLGFVFCFILFVYVRDGGKGSVQAGEGQRAKQSPRRGA